MDDEKEFGGVSIDVESTIDVEEKGCAVALKVFGDSPLNEDDFASEYIIYIALNALVQAIEEHLNAIEDKYGDMMGEEVVNMDDYPIKTKTIQ